jgi:hypothetical protein
LLTKPKFILFIDEVGYNTSQKNDGNVGSKKFLITEDQRAMLRSSFQDCRFTVLGFTNGKGEPVCCVIIVASMEISAKHVLGLQPCVQEVVGDPESNVEENSYGPLKYYLYGLTCAVGGITVVTYVTSSENGFITGNILTDVLRHLDAHLQLDREEATPFLLLDSHRSRFELPFLDYITDERTKWMWWKRSLTAPFLVLATAITTQEL